MKKNLNIIQIKGIKGLILAGFIVSCLFAGFVIFPGWVSMHAWNFITTQFTNLPTIGLLQGILLWGIIAASYFVFRREKVIVCVKNPKGLNEEELKAVFADIKRQSAEDPILQAMLKAREAELQLKNTHVKSDGTEATVNSDNNNI